jgi:hypothetical protein
MFIIIATIITITTTTINDTTTTITITIIIITITTSTTTTTTIIITVCALQGWDALLGIISINLAQAPRPSRRPCSHHDAQPQRTTRRSQPAPENLDCDDGRSAWIRSPPRHWTAITDRRLHEQAERSSTRPLKGNLLSPSLSLSLSCLHKADMHRRTQSPR